MMDKTLIDVGLDIDKVLETGKMVEKIVGRALRSECV
jgi:hydroxymethylglutaryl-CoA lyase